VKQPLNQQPPQYAPRRIAAAAAAARSNLNARMTQVERAVIAEAMAALVSVVT
jgi:hypothetical protein